MCFYCPTKHVTWHQAFLCVVMWHTQHPLLPLTAPSNVETMATASWNQFVTHSLHFVWSVRQSSGAAVGENGARASGASNFSKWGRPMTTAERLPVWLMSDHSPVKSQEAEDANRHVPTNNHTLWTQAEILPSKLFTKVTFKYKELTKLGVVILSLSHKWSRVYLTH